MVSIRKAQKRPHFENSSLIFVSTSLKTCVSPDEDREGDKTSEQQRGRDRKVKMRKGEGNQTRSNVDHQMGHLLSTITSTIIDFINY